MAKHILIVDDDDLLRRSLAFNLQQAGFEANTAARAEDALEMVAITTPDLVILDIGLPGMDGLDALRELKGQLEVPVIFLTARRRELDEVVGLELGADDYVTKPFDVDVLIARIKAVLRRGTKTSKLSPEQPSLNVGDIIIDPKAHSVSVAGAEISLAPREFDLLHTFATNPDHIITVEDLLARVWGAEYIGQPQVVYVHIRWLREKIETIPAQPERILTVRGKGYKFVPREIN